MDEDWAFDAATVGEPGRVGSLWRLHHGVRLPSPTCDFLRPAATKGHGAGGSLLHFPTRAGDHVPADRGYSTARGIRHMAAACGHVIVRVNTGPPVLRTTGVAPFDLPAAVTSPERAGAVGSRPVVAGGAAALRGACVQSERRNGQAGPRGASRTRRPHAKAGGFNRAPWSSRATSSCSPPCPNRPPRLRRCCGGTAPGGGPGRSSGASGRRRNWDTRPNTTTKAPRRGRTASSPSRRWWKSRPAAPWPFPLGDTTWGGRRPPGDFGFVPNQVARPSNRTCL